MSDNMTGYWRYNNKTYMGYIVCSDCGRNINITNPDTVCYYANQFKFCPYCGKKKMIPECCQRCKFKYVCGVHRRKKCERFKRWLRTGE